ncbi:hypothetical protein YC2023_083673 [Brassica napus]
MVFSCLISNVVTNLYHLLFSFKCLRLMTSTTWLLVPLSAALSLFLINWCICPSHRLLERALSQSVLARAPLS